MFLAGSGWGRGKREKVGLGRGSRNSSFQCILQIPSLILYVRQALEEKKIVICVLISELMIKNN
jgi:hypothetical protein